MSIQTTTQASRIGLCTLAAASTCLVTFGPVYYVYAH